MADEIAPDEEGWLGQIILDGRWVDYARGYEHESKVWQAQQPDHRRLVHWITREVLVGHPNVCQGCGIGCVDESCPICTRQHVREQDDRWQVEVDDDLQMSIPGARVRRHRMFGTPGWFWICTQRRTCTAPRVDRRGWGIPTVTDAINAACDHIRTHHHPDTNRSTR